jgi:hypothetical protein
MKPLRLRASIILTSLLLGLLLIPAPISASDSDTVIKVVPARIDVSAGEEFSVEIVIDPDGAEVYSGQYTLKFDPGVLEALSQEEGDFLNEAGVANTVEVANTIDNEAGTLDYGLTRMGVTTGVTTTGTLSRVTFKVIDGDRGSYLNLTDVIVGDTKPNEMPVSIESGVCFVGGNAPASTPEPTATTTEADNTPAPTVTETVTATATATATATTTATTTVTPEAEAKPEPEAISEETVAPVSTPTVTEMKSMPVSTPTENTSGFGVIMSCTGIVIISYALRRRFR